MNYTFVETWLLGENVTKWSGEARLLWFKFIQTYECCCGEVVQRDFYCMPII